ncbi:chitinase [Ralstonia pickettii]|uniref:chitinase n=1 Tax=Ralstonia pickettii TaxID=329 RepID=UPI00271488B5|nr:chitinase [Ralstonia pickettii]WKZ86973.1 chitinase [Ralstonia pickettii]
MRKSMKSKFRVSSRIVGRIFAVAWLGGAVTAAGAATSFAPYVDVTIYPTPSIDQIGVRQGIQQFNLAFVVAGGGCSPSWGGVQPVADPSSDLVRAVRAGISNFRAKGGEVAVSFGGANGTPLMQACNSVSALKTAYQTVLDTYTLSRIDFDIEGASQQDTAALMRNFQAVAQLQSDFAARGKALHVTLTLPAMPYGLTSEGVNILNTAIQNKVVFDVVNLMTMDYGTANVDMGAAAISAAQSLYSQLDAAFKAAGQPKTDGQLWQLVGLTPMIGMNDVQGETFTLANAQTVANAAHTNGYGMVGMWSISRDQPCPNNGAYTAPTCSGVTQQPHDFSAVFTGLSGHWGSGVARDPSYAGGEGGSSGGSVTPGSAWSSTQIYTAGMTVTYQGGTYRAQWWTQGDIPGQASVWKALGGVVQEWMSSVAYQGGQCVLYQGAKYCAKWWTRGDVPTAGGVWIKS